MRSGATAFWVGFFRLFACVASKSSRRGVKRLRSSGFGTAQDNIFWLFTECRTVPRKCTVGSSVSTWIQQSIYHNSHYGGKCSEILKKAVRFIECLWYLILNNLRFQFGFCGARLPPPTSRHDTKSELRGKWEV